MFNFFKKTNYNFTGLLPDLRPDSEKEKDYQQSEILALASPVNWQQKGGNIPWRSFPVFNQNQQNSCVANTMAKLLGIKYFLRDGRFLDFSKAHIYTRRVNKPQEGMVGYDAFEIGKKGVTLESLVPSDYPNDTPIDALKIDRFKEEVGEVFKIKNYIELPTKDFENVASTIQATGKGVMCWFYFNSSEWSQKYPKVIDMGLSMNTGLRHSVTAVDFGLINGKKYIKIEDSAHFGGISERWISEEFFNTRNYYAAYLINFLFEEPDALKPKYIVGNVVSLQDCLKHEGLFPLNVDSTGFFGAVTKKAVVYFQIKYNLSPALGNVGPLTTAKLSQLYP